jgi:hypothetical protein
MSVIETLPKAATVSFTPRQYSLIAYYAAKYKIGFGAVARQMVSAYCDADQGLDLDDYLKYVRETIAPGEETPSIRDAFLSIGSSIPPPPR